MYCLEDEAWGYAKLDAATVFVKVKQYLLIDNVYDRDDALNTFLYALAYSIMDNKIECLPISGL